MLFSLARFEKATRLFGLVGLTSMKLSDSLPYLTLTFVTGATQVNGTDGFKRLVGAHGRSLGFMHLRVPSGTSGFPLIRASVCGDVAGVRKAKMAASTIRRRRVFMSVFLLVRFVENGFKRSQKRRDSLTSAPGMSSLFLTAKILVPTLEADLVLSVSPSRLFAAVFPAPNQPEKRLNECVCPSASFPE